MPKPIKNLRTQIGTLAGVPTKPSTGNIRRDVYTPDSAKRNTEENNYSAKQRTDYSRRGVVQGDGGSPGDNYTDVGGIGMVVSPGSIHGSGVKATFDMSKNRKNQLNDARATVDKSNAKSGNATEGKKSSTFSHTGNQP